MPLNRRPLLIVAAASTVALTATACGSAASESAASAEAAAESGRTQVLASFYPLQFVAEQVGGDHVDVSNLTPPAAEPHDLELSPAQVRTVGDADLVVYLSGFQAAVDEAIDARDATALDAADYVHLEAGPNGADAHDAESGAESEDAHDHDAESESEDDHADDHDHAADEGTDDGHDHGIYDPHFWLDPQRLADLVPAVEEQLAEIDPEHADDFSANAAALTDELATLDEEYATALEPCAGAALVTSHEAFGYLAERYDLDQVGIAGVDPENEPAPARLREIREIVESEGVTTIFTETLTSPKVAETFAKDVGVDTAVLDPIEGLTDENSDYLGIMRSNLTVLEDGLTCS
ncbi:zinc ABC transporter substrate-binding protein [Paraoerskovia sediminicola]|uniref:Zinc ABC transporter substrate-binding protein n=1 Tax=Paraoerskovia sediminicola TaxID=1138587 RepID=A0ABN6XHZ5_9CELL|nr:metal ABC transporter substrate-binding protein [Paraoerskovia sediminicola]BDZ43230.1 zinc ABC transporter substrate-binding protein [Paraoerskovia sediminicola]